MWLAVRVTRRRGHYRRWASCAHAHRTLLQEVLLRVLVLVRMHERARRRLREGRRWAARRAQEG